MSFGTYIAAGPLALNQIFAFVRKATEADEAALKDLIYEFLQYGSEMPTMEIKATRKNAEVFYDLFIRDHIGKCVFVYDNGSINGILWWTEVPSPFETKGRFAQGGTYVKPEFRRLGIATRLRERGKEELRKMGISEIRGVLDHMNKPSRCSISEWGDEEIGGYRRCVL